nr:argininosuccinate lyase, chloroplastic [Quercus suber]POF26435.1 argininosuccinate lyase, chloroplastic [Quercus suber]
MPTSNTKSLLVDRITVMGPPLEQCTDPNPVKLSDLTRNNLSPDCLGIGGEVVVRRESDLAVAAKLDGEVSTELDGEVARGLVYGGVPFRTSHDIVGKSVALCVSKGCQLLDLHLNELRTISPVFDEDVYEFLGVENAVKKFSSYGSTGSECVASQLDYWVTKLEIK